MFDVLVCVMLTGISCSDMLMDMHSAIDLEFR